jgi:hypothetical protein
MRAFMMDKIILAKGVMKRHYDQKRGLIDFKIARFGVPMLGPFENLL